jgi:hypothetical protein
MRRGVLQAVLPPQVPGEARSRQESSTSEHGAAHPRPDDVDSNFVHAGMR